MKKYIHGVPKTDPSKNGPINVNLNESFIFSILRLLHKNRTVSDRLSALNTVIQLVNKKLIFVAQSEPLLWAHRVVTNNKNVTYGTDRNARIKKR